jgi:hypothetical protein
VDPAKACSSASYQHHESVAQQLTRRGPLFVNPFLHQLLEDDGGVSDSGGSGNSNSKPVEVNLTSRESPGLHSSHVVMVGVPAEIAVAIALASFVIGAGLTGMLCCIHHRKAVPKTVS